MPTITSENTAIAVVKLLAAAALPVLVSNLIMGNLVTRDYEPTLQNAGDTVNITIPPTMTANNIAEGGTIQNQAKTIGNASIVLTTHAEVSFQIPDVTKALAAQNLESLYMTPAVVAIAEKIERDLFSLYPQLTSNAAVGAAGADPTEGVIDSAETALFNAKIAGQKYLVMSGDAYGKVRQIPRFSEVDKIGQPAIEALMGGKVGRLKDFTVLRSQYVAVTGSGPATTHNLAFAPLALGLAMRKLPKPDSALGVIAEYVEMGGFGMRVLTTYNKDTLAQEYTVDCLYGAGVIDPRYGLEVWT